MAGYPDYLMSLLPKFPWLIAPDDAKWMTDFLEAATELGILAEDISQAVLGLYRSVLGELLAVQSEGGLWHNILDSKDTFLETSSSAMFLAGLIRGQRHGWLLESPDLVTERIERAWQGLSSRSLSHQIIIGSSSQLFLNIQSTPRWLYSRHHRRYRHPGH